MGTAPRSYGSNLPVVCGKPAGVSNTLLRLESRSGGQNDVEHVEVCDDERDKECQETHFDPSSGFR